MHPIINCILAGMLLTLVMAGAALLLYALTLPDEKKPKPRKANGNKRND